MKNKQFGVSLKELRERNSEDIPIVVRTTVEFITAHALNVEGIFRRSAQVNMMSEG